MNRADLPTLNSLRAFLAVAESGGYSRAARQLNVTHAAVRQQVKALEAWLGLALVVRDGRHIVLTAEGEMLSRDLGQGFDAIHRGVEKLTGIGAARPVQVTMSPAFAVEWLMPRITDFQQRHPDIVLMLNPTAEVMALRPGGIDLAIRYTERKNLSQGAVPLFTSDMVVIGVPALAEQRSAGDAAGLATLPWLQELGTNEVAAWFERRGVVLRRPLAITQMPGNLIMEAVRRGDGITYTVRAFFEQEIAAGEVVVLYSEPAWGCFYLETVPGVVRPAVRAFVKWLRDRAATVE